MMTNLLLGMSLMAAVAGTQVDASEVNVGYYNRQSEDYTMACEWKEYFESMEMERYGYLLATREVVWSESKDEWGMQTRNRETGKVLDFEEANEPPIVWHVGE